MYEAFYNLSGDPFRLSPDPWFSFKHRSYAKARAYLQYGIQRAEGFVMITGSPGTGKTTLISDLLSAYASKDLVIARLTSANVEADDLLRMVAFGFKLNADGLNKAMLMRRIAAFLTQQSRAGRRALLVVDEAQDLSSGALEELRLLTNLQSGTQPLLQIFLLGQEGLGDIVRSPEMEQLHQRLIAACRLEPLSQADTRAYMEYRLGRVGWSHDPRIADHAYELIYRYTYGVPRRVNQLCSRLLLQGALEEKHALDGEDVDAVVQELREELLIPWQEPGHRHGPPGSSGSREPASSQHAPADAEARRGPGPAVQEVSSPVARGRTCMNGDTAGGNRPEPPLLDDPVYPGVQRLHTRPNRPVPVPPRPARTGAGEEGVGPGGGPAWGRQPDPAVHEAWAPQTGTTGHPGPAGAAETPPSLHLDTGFDPGDEEDVRPSTADQPDAASDRRRGPGVASRLLVSIVAVGGLGLLLAGGSLDSVRLDTVRGLADSGIARITTALGLAERRPRLGRSGETNGLPSPGAARMSSTETPGNPEPAKAGETTRAHSAPPSSMEPLERGGPLQPPGPASTDRPAGPVAPKDRPNPDSAAPVPPGVASMGAAGPEPRTDERPPSEGVLTEDGPPARSTPTPDPAARESESSATVSGLATELKELPGTVHRLPDGRIRVRLPSDASFAYDSAVLRPDFTPILDSLAELLRQHRPETVSVVGHTDSAGQASYNRRLSLRRAQGVADYLAQGGITREALKTEGRGAADPIAAEASRSANRRVELLIRP